MHACLGYKEKHAVKHNKNIILIHICIHAYAFSLSDMKAVCVFKV